MFAYACLDEFQLIFLYDLPPIMSQIEGEEAGILQLAIDY
jgi:hypothetical protein